MELGAAGWADVLAVEACPPIGPPPGMGCQVVTGCYAHSAGDTLDPRIAGLDDNSDEVIGVTAPHPFWSEDRQAFVAVGDLKPGELLLTASAQVISLTPRANAEPVYNTWKSTRNTSTTLAEMIKSIIGCPVVKVNSNFLVPRTPPCW